jgi:general L-amino acid transport system substrate-binding protein
MKKMKKALVNLTIAGAMILPGQVMAEAGPTLKMVQGRGTLLCTGHNGSFKGFAEVDDKGNWHGLDIDLCRALAAATLGSAEAVQFVPISWAQRFPAIQSGDVDVIIKATGWTFGRDTDIGLQFSRPYFIGGTQLVVRKELEATSAADLDGGTVCVEGGTSTERSVVNYMKAKGIEVDTVPFEKSEETLAAYFSKRCDAYAGWGPNLAVVRNDAPDGADRHMILPDVLEMEPTAAAMRQGDDNWVDVVNWTISSLVMAEENGITQANVDEIKANPSTPAIAKLLGVTPGMGAQLGLSDDWVYTMIKEVGNYDEIFERSLGKNSPYMLERGLNALWSNSGLFYPLVLD